MKIPNAEDAFIPSGKLERYLLAPEHPVGGPKARFFRSIGFGTDTIPLLEKGLLEIAQSADVKSFDSPHGVKYVGRGELTVPDGRTVRLVTVWIVDPTDPRPRFVTAYPS